MYCLEHFAYVIYQTFLIASSQLLETVQEATTNLEKHGHCVLKQTTNHYI